PHIDALMLFITAICVFFAAAITIAIVFFFFKYHRKESTAIGIVTHEDSRLEAVWMIVPLILAMAMFGWGAVVYVDYRNTPHDTLDVYVVGKQWMWKAQQPNGLKEINELHVPVGRNIRLILASEDVIHDFFVPAFRVKMDVVPGHYNTMWFHRYRRRSLYPRIYSSTKRKNCGRVSAVDAHVPGTVDGGADFRSDRLYQVSAVAAGAREGLWNCAAHREEISYEQHASNARPRIAGRTLFERHLRLRHPFVAVDYRSQAHRLALSRLRHCFLFHRGRPRHHDSDRKSTRLNSSH